MNLSIGTNIVYTSAAGTREAVIKDIFVGPTAKPGFMNTWLTIEVVISKKLGTFNTVQIPADNGSLKAFKVAVID